LWSFMRQKISSFTKTALISCDVTEHCSRTDWTLADFVEVNFIATC
jgi:hypothetical protein